MLPDFDWPRIVERQRREIEFLELLSDTTMLSVNGIPWRRAFDKINEIVTDPV